MVRTSVLIIDEDRVSAAMMSSQLLELDCQVACVTSTDLALDQLNEHPFDVAVVDAEASPMRALPFLSVLKDRFPEIKPIVATSATDFQSVVSAFHAGARDVVAKPTRTADLRAALNRAAAATAPAPAPRPREISRAPRRAALIGSSDENQKVIALIDQIADSDAAVLIVGESGTGKELVARAIHDRSSRRAGPFVALNCAAVPDTLIESELFGHSHGAFTGAIGPRDGMFVQATGGTLFLDEIGEMPLSMQVKLLRSLQENMVRPLGADHEIAFDARIVVATNRDLEHEIAEGRFRGDLLYRINVVTIEVPPLRARGGDVLELARHFLKTFSVRLGKKIEGFSTEASEKLAEYHWPGNVRELENCIERAVVLTRGDVVSAAELPEAVRNSRNTKLELATNVPDKLISLAELESRYIRHVLAVMDGNKSQAARVLGIDRRSLYRRLQEL